MNSSGRTTATLLLALLATVSLGAVARAQETPERRLSLLPLPSLRSETGHQDPPVAEESAPPPAEEEGLPLPLHTIEGNGGHFSVMSAYLVNPGPEGTVIGKPAVGIFHVHLNHGKHLEALTLSETFFRRLELSYAFNTLDVGDSYSDFEDLFEQMGSPTSISGHSQKVHNLNARVQLLSEGAFDRSWVPAVTAGAHYKYNPTWDDLNRDVFRSLPSLGFERDYGFEYTLTATKTFLNLPRPVCLSVGARYTDAAHLGLLGFTDDYRVLAEAAVTVLATDRIAFVGEFRQKSSDYQKINDVLEREDNWWTLCVGYLVNSHLSVSGGYGHFGWLLNHTSNKAFGMAVKYQF